ncbi:hypothetical protein D9M68_717040 [compost metagenome]
MVMANPAMVISRSPCRPISSKPAAATNKPNRLVMRRRSPRNSAANNRVKNAWDCSTSEARPAGMPTDMA